MTSLASKRISRRLFTNRLNHYNTMTRTSIEGWAKGFVVVLFLLFLYSAYRVGEMIGWF